jgi:hypothetical protein
MLKKSWSVVLVGVMLTSVGVGCSKDSTPVSPKLDSPPALNTGFDKDKAKQLQPPEPPPPPPK